MINGKYVYSLWILAGLLLSMGYSPRSVAVDLKIGFVDIPYLIDEAPQSLAASGRLETEFAPRQDSIKSQKSKIADIRSRLEDVSSTLSSADRTNLERELRKTERRVKRDEQEFREELNIQKNQEFKRVRVSVLDAIATFARTHDYDLILSDGVLFANKRIDVTREVLLELRQAVESQSSTDDRN